MLFQSMCKPDGMRPFGLKLSLYSPNYPQKGPKNPPAKALRGSPGYLRAGDIAILLADGAVALETAVTLVMLAPVPIVMWRTAALASSRGCQLAHTTILTVVKALA